MGPDTISVVIDIIGQQVTAAMAGLIPVGQALTGSFVVLSILMLGMSLVSGGAAFIGPLVRMCAAGAGTYWAIGYWPDITLGTLRAARAAVGLLIGNYSGPATLFKMASDVSGRITAEAAVPVRFWDFNGQAQQVVEGFASILVWLGLSVTGLLAVLAEFELLIGGAVAPLVLPALAFGLTRSIGFGAVTYMVSAGVRVVVMGTVSFVMGQAVTAVVGVPGTDQPLTWTQETTLLGVALLTAIVGLSCNSLARGIVGGSPGALGLGSALGPAATTFAAAQTVVRGGKAGGTASQGGGGGGSGVGGQRGWGEGKGGAAAPSGGGAAGGGESAGAGAAGSGSKVAVSSERRSAFG